MNKEKDFRYFYGMEADEYTFLRVPKILFRDPDLRNLSTDAKLLYGMMLDRLALSRKNQWFDEENRVYICFTVENVVDELGCGRNKAMKSMKELEDIGIIERKRLGLGKNNIIYVKRFMKENEEKNTVQKFKNQTSELEKGTPEVLNVNFQKFKNQTSESPEIKPLEVYFGDSNNTDLINNDLNNTHYSDIESNHIQSEGVDEIRCDVMPKKSTEDIIREIKKQIEYEPLFNEHEHERALLNFIVEIIAEIYLGDQAEIQISRDTYPRYFVEKRFRLLRGDHIEYVMDCFRRNTTKVRNIKKYMQAALFNAPVTIESYYMAEVHHDMPWLVADAQEA